MSTINNLLGEDQRRDKLRFPIEQDVQYQCVKRGRLSAVGVGKTLQISSREVHFTTQHLLMQGERVLLDVDWPARLDSTCLMKLQIYCPVVRSEPGVVVVQIARHEFRTRGASLRILHLGGCVNSSDVPALRVIEPNASW
jgi:hypothetical protein